MYFKIIHLSIISYQTRNKNKYFLLKQVFKKYQLLYRFMRINKLQSKHFNTGNKNNLIVSYKCLLLL